MKKLLFLFFITFISAQMISVPSKNTSTNKILSAGSGTNTTTWSQQVVYVDSGASKVGVILAGEPLIGIAITSNLIWDSDTTHHYDTTWTTCNLGFLAGYKREYKNYSGIETSIDTLDFLPIRVDTLNYVLKVKGMSYIPLDPDYFLGIKYMYIQFINRSTGALVPQANKRKLVLFYRKY